MGFRLQQLLRIDDRYQLSCWLFLRGLALIYFIAFLSLAVQITGLAGPNGILPFYETLNYTHVQHGWLAWLRFPTVFWLDASDVALKMAAYGGAILAVLLFFERWQTAALIGMYVLYVSLFHAGDLFLTFQWDTLLLETGFLSIFLVKGGPNKLLLFMFHWLLFRLRSTIISRPRCCHMAAPGISTSYRTGYFPVACCMFFLPS
jgi:hypothetical protein